MTLALVAISLVVSIAFFAVIYTVRLSMLDAKAQADRLQLAHMDALNRIKEIMTETLDRVQSRSLVEAIEVAHLRSQNEATVNTLKDELSRGGNGHDHTAPSSKRIFHSIDGKEFREDELETW